MNDFEAYHEFGLENMGNVHMLKDALDKVGIEYQTTEGGGIFFFIFNNAADEARAHSIALTVIDVEVESEWKENSSKKV